MICEIGFKNKIILEIKNNETIVGACLIRYIQTNIIMVELYVLSNLFIKLRNLRKKCFLPRFMSKDYF